jgi:hypothetical protein
MQTAADFMQDYLRESARFARSCGDQQVPLLRKFFSDDYVKAYEDRRSERQINAETFESSDTFETGAKVITVENRHGKQQRYRYHLRVAGDCWQIYIKESECFLCRGIPRKSMRNLWGSWVDGAWQIACLN